MILCFRCSIRLLLCRIAVDVSELVPERYWVGGHEHAYQDSTVARDQGRHAGDDFCQYSEGKEQPVKHEERPSKTKCFFAVEHSSPPTFVHAPFDAFASDDFRTDARASEHVHRPGTQLELVFHIADEIPVPGDPFLTALVNGVETTQVLSFLGIEWLVAWPCLRFGPVHSALLQRFLFQE